MPVVKGDLAGEQRAAAGIAVVGDFEEVVFVPAPATRPEAGPDTGLANRNLRRNLIHSALF